jgi:hypothetical protein
MDVRDHTNQRVQVLDIPVTRSKLVATSDQLRHSRGSFESTFFYCDFLFVQKESHQRKGTPMNPPFRSVLSLEKSGSRRNSLRFTPLRQPPLSPGFFRARSPGSKGGKDKTTKKMGGTGKPFGLCPCHPDVIIISRPPSALLCITSSSNTARSPACVWLRNCS